MKRYLILEDGSVFPGVGFGAETVTTGEIVFNTGMSGYQETITDQSYNGQIITFTQPLIGNVGINRDDYESIDPTAKGIVVRDVARVSRLIRHRELAAMWWSLTLASNIAFYGNWLNVNVM